MTNRTGTCVDCGEPFLAGKGARKRCNTCADEHARLRVLALHKKRRAARKSERAATQTTQPQETAR